MIIVITLLYTCVHSSYGIGNTEAIEHGRYKVVLTAVWISKEFADWLCDKVVMTDDRSMAISFGKR